MTSLVPRPPYSEEELRQLYPSHLALEQVQIVRQFRWWYRLVFD